MTTPSEPHSLRDPQQRDTELPSVATPPTVAPSTRRGQRIALAILVGLAFIAAAWIASPLWVGLMLGTVMAFTAQPLYRKLANRLGNRRALAAAITTFLGGAILIAGTSVVLYVLTRELIIVANLLQQRLAERSIGALAGEGITRALEALHLDRAQVIARIQEELTRASSYAAQAVGAVLQGTASALLTLVLALFSMYYVLLHWPRIAIRLERLLPLDPRHTRALILEFRDVGRSAFIGTIAMAAVQGILAGVGFWVAGVPQPVTWGAATVLASFIPVVGTGLVWGSVGIYLIVNGHAGWGIFVFAWGLLVVMATSDYVIRPRLVGARGRGGGHPLLMLVALLGGIDVLGLAGLIAGPVVMSIFLAIVRIYERELSTGEPRPDASSEAEREHGAP